MRPAIKHSFEAKFEIKSIKETLTHRVYGGTPIDALHDLHKLVQNSMHWGPDDYVVTFLKRDGFAPYDLPPDSRNPDVRSRHVTVREGGVNYALDLGAVESVKQDNPIFVLPVGAPAANTSSQP